MKQHSHREPVTKSDCSGCDAVIALEAGPALAALGRVARRARLERPAASADADCEEPRLRLARAQYHDLDLAIAGGSRVLDLLSAHDRLPSPQVWLAENQRQSFELAALLEQALHGAESSAALRARGIDVESLGELLAFVSAESPRFRPVGKGKLELHSKSLGTLALRWSPAPTRNALLQLLGAPGATLAGSWQGLRDVFAVELRRREDAAATIAGGELAELAILGIIILILVLVGGTLAIGCAATENKFVCSLAKGLLMIALLLLETLPLLSGGSSSGKSDGEDTLATGSPLTVHVQRAPGLDSQLPPHPATT